MPFYLSPKVFSNQAKALVKHWPFKPIKISAARNLLSQLYGYKNDHHYRKVHITTTHTTSLVPCSEEIVQSHYREWIQRFAKLGAMNEIQARQLMHMLWPAYLNHNYSLTTKMYHALFRFNGHCTDFLNDEIKNVEIKYDFDDTPAIGDAIQAMGIPHTEVGLIRVNDKNVDLNFRLNDGDKVSVYPSSAEYTNSNMPWKPNSELTFLLDVHLGGLARYLRMAGFNCLFENHDHGDSVLAEVASVGEYILLTRDKGLLKRSKVKYGRWVRAVKPIEQFREIVKHYHLAEHFNPLSRCIKCNGTITTVKKEEIKTKVPKKVYANNITFSQCAKCEQIYWQGGHFGKIQKILTDVKNRGL
ncbi:Mut7-C RNAse domain-containing protein [Pseudoalteromonas luteoviolacea]|uniref:Mut7-C RNAse domain-containing protein n=1 Tax=Pseudoalteromonas luteoviolacea TaxID=43657 RepID=UPI001B392E9A|nr:Mut7-C RNAse domain-containing protein [Pseudoalteromonas luteoviolacea]MBQ4837540.1 hypothetical protein [Pseudoalteromonas luteoviolacea]